MTQKNGAEAVVILHPDGTYAIDFEALFQSMVVNLEVGDVEIGAVELKDASSSNRAVIDASGRVSVDGSGVTQPVSADSLPLPSGAATSAGQTAALSALEDIAANTETAATAAAQASGNASLSSIDGKLPDLSAGRIPVVLPPGGSGLTDAELRATAVPVSIADSIEVTGPLTNSELRATAVDASVAALELAQGDAAAGALGPLVMAAVSDTPNSLLDGEVRPLSMTPEGRLRVSSIAAYTELDFFGSGFDFGSPTNIFTGPVSSPWGM